MIRGQSTPYKAKSCRSLENYYPLQALEPWDFDPSKDTPHAINSCCGSLKIPVLAMHATWKRLLVTLQRRYRMVNNLRVEQCSTHSKVESIVVPLITAIA